MTAYDKLLCLRRKHLKLLRVCGKSKRWWNGEIAAQLTVIRDNRMRYGRNREWVREWYRLRNLIRDRSGRVGRTFAQNRGRNQHGKRSGVQRTLGG